jgi:hypothetical protein
VTLLPIDANAALIVPKSRIVTECRPKGRIGRFTPQIWLGRFGNSTEFNQGDLASADVLSRGQPKK